MLRQNIQPLLRVMINVKYLLIHMQMLLTPVTLELQNHYCTKLVVLLLNCGFYITIFPGLPGHMLV
jgi:hypothetical protein